MPCERDIHHRRPYRYRRADMPGVRILCCELQTIGHQAQPADPAEGKSSGLFHRWRIECGYIIVVPAYRAMLSTRHFHSCKGPWDTVGLMRINWGTISSMTEFENRP